MCPAPTRPKQNTDRELWRENPDSYYSPSIFVTERGGIGMNVGGHVIVMPIEGWHRLGSSFIGFPGKDKDALRAIASTLRYWLDFQKQERDAEGIDTVAGTFVMRVPHWPTRAMFEAWIKVITDAAEG